MKYTRTTEDFTNHNNKTKFSLFLKQHNHDTTYLYGNNHTAEGIPKGLKHHPGTLVHKSDTAL